MDDLLDQNLPEITRLALYIQNAYNKLQEQLSAPEPEEEAVELQEFIVLQLLLLGKVPRCRAT